MARVAAEMSRSCATVRWSPPCPTAASAHAVQVSTATHQAASVARVTTAVAHAAAEARKRQAAAGRDDRLGRGTRRVGVARRLLSSRRLKRTDLKAHALRPSEIASACAVRTCSTLGVGVAQTSASWTSRSVRKRMKATSSGGCSCRSSTSPGVKQ
eukprot:1487574-Prymnesium_polylepis.2